MRHSTKLVLLAFIVLVVVFTGCSSGSKTFCGCPNQKGAY